MDDKRLAAIEAKLDALMHVVICHIVAADVETPGLAAKTLNYARDQADSAINNGRVAMALNLQNHMDTLRAILDLPAND